MEVTVQDVLKFRDKKAEIQKQLTEKFPNSIIVSLGMNIPGPVKTGLAVYYGFCEGKENLEWLLSCRGTIRKKMQIEDKAGYAAVYAVDGEERQHIKERTIELEETHLLGRIWDIDVLDEQSVPLMRQQLGIAERKCLLCNSNARECCRSRKHSAKELQEKVFAILESWMAEQDPPVF
ncbi:citrate lyase holo-[acyl-carrier protein] synthase [Faecalicatena acetigenes]|uniref:citrate lyase holo-[acyl-carrier protein] synthase n=1 Tax=Faecalicatena acetigenes TaxID=2981790 RepID=A0ABT2TAR2_9FIRM|nr:MULTISPECIES: citrate lyase holo-[acyl-carrier protein] synthase [Lachnospiraceae]MCU6746967.1 citrate lyase holo-[acyl-carrier protein] synthase [Faecalicatena acetigenes]SCH56370.1 2'-(5''-triphosphoribosyl)-3'-dephospho-CoA:apo-citrate lyase [uncultured Clostridium sp.]